MIAGCRTALSLAALLAAAACFSEHTTGPPDGSRVPDIACSVPLPTPAADEVVVGIRDFAFHPATISVAPGTRVTWINCEESGIAAHTATSDEDLWDSGLLPAAEGATFTRVFDVEGDFDYHCTPHPFMQGRVTVEAS